MQASSSFVPGSQPPPFILQVDRVILFGGTMDTDVLNAAKEMIWQHVNPKCLFVGVLLQKTQYM